MAEYKVAEMFSSINGEGPRAGQLAFFIRMQGCNLQCSYCDTAWANRPDTAYTRMTTKEILNRIQQEGITNITLTGGEPLLCNDIMDLVDAIASSGKYRLEIETNGSIPLDDFLNHEENISLTMDYKLPGSRMENAMQLRNFRILKKNDSVKFVVSDQRDLDCARELIQETSLQERCHVYFSPVFGRIRPAEIVDYMKKYRLNDVNLRLQMHKIIWDPDARGV